MRSFMRLVFVLTIPVALFVSCDSGSSGPPAPEPFADPEVCDVPCEVVLDSGIEAEGRPLTFTWDVGDGPMDGDERLLHTFEATGTYEVTVTVSDGSQSATDTVTVRAVPQPTTEATIEAAGGAVSQGAAKLTVPADVAPEPVPIELKQLPSMQVEGERFVGVGQFTALGSAYQISTPLKTATPMDIAVTDPDTRSRKPVAVGAPGGSGSSAGKRRATSPPRLSTAQSPAGPKRCTTATASRTIAASR